MTFSHVLGAASAAMTPSAVKSAAGELRKSEPRFLSPAMKSSFLPGVVTGAAGAYMWKKHRVLGFLMGDAIGARAYQIYRGDNRKGAVADIAAAGAGVAGSLYWKKHPVLGWIGGSLAGAVVTSFVEGSTAYKIRHGF